MLISLTVGKVDAGIAILLTEDRRLIEFPSILLPQGISSGSIVDIQVSRNNAAELASANAFSRLQEEIYTTFGVKTPEKPRLRVRNVTQTSVVLEWDPINLATASLRSMTLYRNGGKSGYIPEPTVNTTTKISGLGIDSPYNFYIVLKTSAGTFTSDEITVHTQKITDLSGVTVCPGVMPPDVREAFEATLQRIGAKPLQDFVRMDTTHFVCTEGRGQAWERAMEKNIPVVRPEWLEACEREGRLVSVRGYYLNADPRLRPALRSRPQPTNPAQQQSPQAQQQQQQPPQQQQQQPQQQQQQPPPAPRGNSLDHVAAAAATAASQSPAQQSSAPSTDDTTSKDERSVSPAAESSPSPQPPAKKESPDGDVGQSITPSKEFDDVPI